MFEQQSTADTLKYRLKKSILIRQLGKMTLMLKMGSLKGTFYLRAHLMKLDLVKKIFVLEIEQD